MSDNTKYGECNCGVSKGLRSDHESECARAYMPPKPFSYPEAWKAFWERWLGEHSMMRCPGPPCPGGCGASAKDALKRLADLGAMRKLQARRAREEKR